MRARVAIVHSHSFGRLYPEHLDRLSAFADVTRLDVPTASVIDDVTARIKDAHAIIASTTPNFDRELLSKLPNLLIVARHGVGIDNVDLAAATDLGIMVANVPGVIEQEAVAEHALALMLSLTRRIGASSRAVREDGWERRAEFVGMTLRGKRVGIIGCGFIGQRLSELLHHGIRAEVVAYDPAVSAETMRAHGAEKVALDELLSTAHVISINCALSSASFRMFDRQTFGAMRRGVLVVNTARGEIVDLDALLEALRTGVVAGYATDVVEGEPVRADHPLLAFPQVLVLPHLGGYTLESLRDMGETMVDSLERVLKYQLPPVSLLNSDAVLTANLAARYAAYLGGEAR